MEKAKNAEEYIEQQRMAISSNPECGTSHYNLGVGLLGLRKFEEAEKEFFAALECSPSLAEAYVQLGGICLNRGDLDGCLAFNQQAVKARPGFSEGYGNIGFVHMQKGNIDDAIVALERATFFNFRFIQAFTTLANAYLIKGDIEKCIETNKKALELEPDFAVAHNNLTIAYLEKGDDVSAVWHCDRAVALAYEVAPEILDEIQEIKARLKPAQVGSDSDGAATP
ncbi:MAG: tetratricopeptide repeat protein [Desulfatirhabdiaceae bacterium]